MIYWHGEDLDLLMLLRLTVLTLGHSNYTEIITKRSPLFNQFIITLIYKRLLTQIPLIFINISKTNYLLINHIICTTPDAEKIVILILQFLIVIEKLYNVIWPSNPHVESLPSSLKNYTSKFTNKKQIKSRLLPSLILTFFISNLVSS